MAGREAAVIVPKRGSSDLADSDHQLARLVGGVMTMD